MNNNSNKILNIVLTGGGTAGHVWPHFALIENPASEFAQKFNNGELIIHYIGSKQGMEKELVANYAPRWNYKGISTGKLRRYFSWQNFTDPFRIIWGFIEAFIYLYQVNASVLFSKGGFVSAPSVWAAYLLRIPVVIHESDVTPALATKLTIPFARKCLAAFQETSKYLPQKYQYKIIPIGLPLRISLFTASKEEAIAHFNLNKANKTLLVFGGSLGAEGLNKNLIPALPELCDKINIIHITGKGKLKPNLIYPNYVQFEFLSSEMRLAYAAADFCICRAGASSIFELAAARIPMILVPLGLHQSRGDQIINAKIFAKNKWAVVLPEDEMQKDKLVQTINEMLTKLEQYKADLQSAPSPDAADKVGSLLLELARK